MSGSHHFRMPDQRQYATIGQRLGYVIAVNIVILLMALIEIPIITQALGRGQPRWWPTGC
jgi:hypothetical protein